MPQVLFSIEADGVDVTSSIKPILISMSITDSEGLQSDTLSITINDTDGSVEPPRTGVTIRAVGGYEGQLRDFGEFSVDSVSYQGWPQTITVSAQSVAAKKLAKQKDPKSYKKEDFPTYGDIIKDIAKRVGVQAAISASISSIQNPFEAQSEEGALEFLTRIGEKLNASVTVKSGRLVVMEKGSGIGAGGSALDLINVTRPGNLLSYSVNEKDEPKHSEVEASSYDRKKNERKAVTESTGLEGPKFVIRAPFQDEAEAKRAAKSKVKELVRAQADASFTIDGYPFAQAEAFVSASGIRSRVDGLWKVKTATHTFSASGPYTTELSCEVPSP